MERRILHADFNGFYASVACLLDPTIRERPVAVAGDPAARHGIILAKNEIAKRYGVRTGEAIWQAKQKCPGLVTVAPDFPEYHRFSELGREIYAEYSDRVEGFGLDENWIDITACTKDFQDAERMAHEIRARIRTELGITVSIGAADNKVFAKLGSDMKKPDAVTVVSPANYKETAWKLPVGDLLYVGRATQQKLNRFGVMTIGDLARTPVGFLRTHFGKVGPMLSDFANGRDTSEVMLLSETRRIKSVSNGITAPYDLTTDTDVYLTLTMLSESVAARLRAEGLYAKTVQIAVRDAALHTVSHQCKLEKPSCLSMELARGAMGLFSAHYDWHAPVRSVTVGTQDLVESDSPVQLSLFSDEEKRERLERAERAVDGIRGRFGYHAIGRAIFLKDDRIGRLNPREENTVHPVGYLHDKIGMAGTSE